MEHPGQPDDALDNDARAEASPYEPDPPASHAGWEPPFPPPRRMRAVDVVVLLAIVLASGTLHFARLSVPDFVIEPPPRGGAGDTDSEYRQQCVDLPRLSETCHEMIPLDEWHYIPDARDVILYGTESDTRVPPNDGAYVVHPPVGKWFIAAGIKLFGDRGFGWRFFGALFGTLSTLIIYLLARRLWGSPWLAAMAATLLPLTGLYFVMARIAMLDIYASFFVLLGVWLVVEDRARTHLLVRGVRWWRLGAGVAFGLALATKWAIAPFIVVAVASMLGWELYLSARKGEAAEEVLGRLGKLALITVLLPLTIYVGTHTPWFVSETRYNPPLCEQMGTDWLTEKPVGRLLTGWVAHTGRYGQWVCYQKEIFNFHRDLEKFTTETREEDGEEITVATPGHPYFGNAWAWPWIGRPVAHYYTSEPASPAAGRPQDEVRQILGAPNPVVWYAGFLVLPLLAWWTIRRRDSVATLVFALFMAGWLPYLFADIIGRPVFLFYATPMLPFLVLGIVHVAARARERFAADTATVAVVVLALAVAMFVYLYPVYAAYPIGPDGFGGWSGRMLLRVDCSAEDAIKNFCWI